MRYKKLKITLGVWWRNWKRLHKKPYRECDTDELLKKRDFHRHMSYSYLSSILILLGLIMELYSRDQVDLIFNMLLILVMLALYDTKNEINHIDQFIYMKEQEK